MIQKNKTQNVNIENKYLPLVSDKATDICIIGGGIAGLLNAYNFLKHGFKVIILDQHQPNQGTSQNSTGHLSDILDEGISRIIQVHGLEKTREIIKSHRWAIEYLKNIIDEENIDCNFEFLDGVLIKSPNTSIKYLEEEITAAKALGLFACKLNSNGYESIEAPAIVYPKQAKLNLAKFCTGLLHKILNLGGEFYANTEVSTYEDSRIPLVQTRNGSLIYCKHIIFCTNKPLDNKVTNYNNQAVFKTFTLQMKIPKKSFPNILLWDTTLPYHYAHLEKNSDSANDTLVLGGEDVIESFLTDPQEKYSLVQDWALIDLGLLGDVEKEWVGTVTETSDGLGYIGRPLGKKNIFIVNGDSGHGITQAAISTVIMSNLIQNKDHVWIHIYAPFRFKLKSYNTRVTSALRAANLYKTRWQERNSEYETEKLKLNIEGNLKAKKY